jgi:hypothetical protein
MIVISRDHARNVKRWRDGQMALRWCAAGMIEASGQFRRVNGHLHLPALRASLERHVAAQNVGPRLQHSRRERRLMLTGPPPKFHGTRDILQSATVWEVFGAHQRTSLRALWNSGMRVGKEPMAAVVNTLVLAYVGASLPLFLLLTLSTAPLMHSVNNEEIAAEVVRSMVGALGLVASIPITTGLAALLLVMSRDRSRPTQA